MPRVVGERAVGNPADGVQQRSDADSVLQVAVEAAVADREVGDVGVWNEPIARFELDGRPVVADEQAVVDDGQSRAAVVADAEPEAVIILECRPRNLTKRDETNPHTDKINILKRTLKVVETLEYW